MNRFCLICGLSEDEVRKLFCFPHQPERLKIWKEKLGINVTSKVSGNHRICDKHFSNESFVPCMDMLKLKRDAVPFGGPKHEIHKAGDAEISDFVIPETPFHNISEDVTSVKESNAEVSLNPIRKSIFVEIQGLCSSKEKGLLSLVRKKETHIRKFKKTCKVQSNSLKTINITTLSKFTGIFKGMSPTAVQFLVSRIRYSKRDPHGRCWTLEDKLTALAISKQNPKCYNFLRYLLALPSKKTLTEFLDKIPFSVGINPDMFKYLGDCLKKYPKNERICTVTFDEMRLRTHLYYNSRSDSFEGVEDFGTERTNRIANYALVFMAQGITSPWKQPLAFYFSHGRVDSVRLESLLKEVLSAMKNNGIVVMATICDMATANVKALRNMCGAENSSYFNYEGQTICTIFDAPSLLTKTRDLFHKYNIQLPSSDILPSCDVCDLQATWSDIVKSYESDKESPPVYRFLRKFKDYYLTPLRQNSMKVKIAAQTLSRITGSVVNVMIQYGRVPLRALATAKFITDVDKLFDSCNGSADIASEHKPYNCAVNKKSGHTQHWTDCIEMVQQWRFLRNRNTSNAEGADFWKPPTQKGWVITLQALIKLWENLQKIKIKSMKPRHLNYDALQNLFSAIRSDCGSNRNPTVSQFIVSFKTLLVVGLDNQTLKETNREEDELQPLTDLKSFLNVENNMQASISEASDFASGVERLVFARGTESLSVAYVAACIIQSLFAKFSCTTCEINLTTDDLEPCNQFIAATEFCGINKKLVYPSVQLVVAVGNCITCMEVKLNINSKCEKNLSSSVKIWLDENVDFQFLNCPKHSAYIRECIISSTCEIGLPWYCNSRGWN